MPRSIFKNHILSKILSEKTFLIVDNAPSLSNDIEIKLRQIFDINGLNFNDFKYHYVQATSKYAVKKIIKHNNIIVSTTFTTIKSDAIERLIHAGITLNLKNKNVFSLMQFSIVGSDFESYKDDIDQFANNNVRFYFISDDASQFELHK